MIVFGIAGHTEMTHRVSATYAPAGFVTGLMMERTVNPTQESDIQNTLSFPRFPIRSEYSAEAIVTKKARKKGGAERS